jgi:serine O-acetyltransferase
MTERIGTWARAREDVSTVRKRDPAAPSTFVIVVSYQGVHAIWYHRVANWLWRKGRRSIARLLSQWSRLWTGIEIHPGAVIGRRLFIDHGMGVVVGETAVIGDDVLMFNGINLGGTSMNPGKRHPTVGDRVVIGAGAKILGPVFVGDDSRIGANAVVVKDVPRGATAVGVPAVIREHPDYVESHTAASAVDDGDSGVHAVPVGAAEMREPAMYYI